MKNFLSWLGVVAVFYLVPMAYYGKINWYEWSDFARGACIALIGAMCVIYLWWALGSDQPIEEQP